MCVAHSTLYVVDSMRQLWQRTYIVFKVNGRPPPSRAASDGVYNSFHIHVVVVCESLFVGNYLFYQIGMICGG